LPNGNSEKERSLFTHITPIPSSIEGLWGFKSNKDGCAEPWISEEKGKDFHEKVFKPHIHQFGGTHVVGVLYGGL
jgi:hypothetical protein